eukprot:747468-Hanusia_phi.AAC.2
MFALTRPPQGPSAGEGEAAAGGEQCGQDGAAAQASTALHEPLEEENAVCSVRCLGACVDQQQDAEAGGGGIRQAQGQEA